MHPHSVLPLLWDVWAPRAEVSGVSMEVEGAPQSSPSPMAGAGVVLGHDPHFRAVVHPIHPVLIISISPWSPTPNM
jgi:hypothetical protein